jgi:hypothetical protein
LATGTHITRTPTKKYTISSNNGMHNTRGVPQHTYTIFQHFKFFKNILHITFEQAPKIGSKNKLIRKNNPHGLYNITVQCNNLHDSLYIPEVGPVWRKHDSTNGL